MAELWDVLDKDRNKTGRLHERGMPMGAGDYHLVVHIWIMNGNGEFLVSQRTPGAELWSGLWQTTGGCAIAGDDSLSAALRETEEELGIKLDPHNGQIFRQYEEPHVQGDGVAFFDVWFFRQEVDISSIVFQPEETVDAMWASREKIKQMMDAGIFMPREDAYPYIDDLFERMV